MEKGGSLRRFDDDLLAFGVTQYRQWYIDTGITEAPDRAEEMRETMQRLILNLQQNIAGP